MTYSEYFFQQWLNRRRAKAATAVFVVIGAIAAGYFLNKQVERSWDKVKSNDVLYADSTILKDSSLYGLATYRRIRPFGINEINKMNIPKWEKEKRIAQLDTGGNASTPYMVASELFINRDLMFQHQTTKAGTFIKKDSITAEMPKDGMHPSPEKWYAVTPNLVLCTVNQSFKLPENYVYADEFYYLSPAGVILNGEPSLFNHGK